MRFFKTSLKRTFFSFFISLNAFAFFSSEIAPSSFDWKTSLDSLRSSGVQFGVQWNGERSYQENEGLPQVPASVQKMFIAYAAYKTFGPDRQFETKLRWKNVKSSDTAGAKAITNLVMELSGDPSWGLTEFKEDEYTRFDAFAKQLRDDGVTDYYGDVEIQLKDSRWNDVHYAQGTLDRHTYQCFGALPDVLNINRNCAVLVINGYNKGYWFHNDVATPVRYEMTYGSRTALTIVRSESGKEYVVSGTWVKGSKSSRKYLLPTLNIQLWAKNLMMHAFLKAGIAMHSANQNLEFSGENSEIIASPKIHEILRATLKNSINVVASWFYYAVGFERDPEHRYSADEAAHRALFDILHELNSSFDLNDLKIFDGSGLSYDDRVTPKFVYEFLNNVRTSDVMTYFFDALPIAGVDGTLEDRMKGTVAQGMLRAKTGTLDVASNLAGYIPLKDPSGNMISVIPFVLFGNTPDQVSRSSQIRDVANQAGVMMVRETNRPSSDRKK